MPEQNRAVEIHPTNSGYRLMWAAIVQAFTKDAERVFQNCSIGGAKLREKRYFSIG